MKIILITVFTLVICLFMIPMTGAQEYNKLTPGDARYLPKFCRYTFDLGAGSPQYKIYVKKYGRSWQSMHHFCRGIRAFQKAITDTSEQGKLWRKSKISSAIKEFDYVLNRSTNKFPYKPMILTMRGDYLRLIGKDIQSLQSYYEAIKIQPKYDDAYIGIGRYYFENGKKDKAVKIIKLGLKKNPGSKRLRLFIRNFAK